MLVWVRVCRDFIAAACRRSQSILDQPANVDEMMVSYHTPFLDEKKNKQWSPKGQPGPIKTSRAKQMLPGLLRREGTHLHEHSTQGLHYQCDVHHEGPGHLHEVFEEEGAGDGRGRALGPLGQSPSVIPPLLFSTDD